MAFNNSNYGNNNGGYNNNNNGGEKKKTNFKVGRIYGSDGILEVSVWNSDKGGVYGIMSIKAAIGKDPSTGMNAYEQKMSGELPSIFMNVEILRALVEYLKSNSVEQLSADIDTGRGATMSIHGSPTDVKITINNQKTGTRTITIKAMTIGNKNINASMLNLIDYLTICCKHAKLAKIDGEEFAKALADGEDTSDAAADVPFN